MWYLAGQRWKASLWYTSQANEWDYCMAGKGASAGSLEEEIEAELQVMAVRHTCGALIDMKKFYDNIGLEWLMVTARELDFPKDLIFDFLRSGNGTQCD